MKIIMAGASGLIGRALVPSLRAQGHDVFRLVRRTARAADEIEWNPAERKLDPTQLEEIDGVINLAGENVAARRWTAAQRDRILQSRTDSTLTLVTAMAKVAKKPAVFLNASAVGFYGERGDEELTESSEIGRGFLPGVCLAWETHATGAERSGIRTVRLRFGVVLARDEGALGRMLPLFRWGLGGRLGSGRQWMSWVGIDDAVRAIGHALSDPRCVGAINVVSPTPVTNAEFSATLGRVLGRPAKIAVPAWALRLTFGAMADEALLASTRAFPTRLLAIGYTFQHPTLEVALREMLGKG